MADWIAQSFTHYAVTDILTQLEQALSGAQQKLNSAQAELDQVAQLRQNLVDLEVAIGTANNGFDELSIRYGDTQPDMLLVDLDVDAIAASVIEAGTADVKVGDEIEPEVLVLEDPASE